MSIRQKFLDIIDQLPENCTEEEIVAAIDKNKTTVAVWKNTSGRTFFIIACLAAIATFFMLTLAPELNYVNMGIYAAWLVIPPIWFLYEYTRIFPDELKLKAEHLSDFKFTQELSSKFWAASLVLFGIILAHNNHVFQLK